MVPSPARPPEADDPGHEPEPLRVPVEDALDLHAFAPRDIPEVVGEYLEAAAARGLREIRLIHGKGIGFQRDRVRRLLEGHPRVESFADAPAERGHWGATVVRLRLSTLPEPLC